MMPYSTHFYTYYIFRWNPTLGHIFVKTTRVHFLTQTGFSSRKRTAVESAELATTPNPRTPVVNPHPKVQKEVIAIWLQTVVSVNASFFI